MGKNLKNMLGLLVVCVLFGAIGETAVLCLDGKPCASIVIGAGAQPQEEYAAKELQYYIEKISGACLPIYSEQSLGDRSFANAIVIGTKASNRIISDSGFIVDEGLGIKVTADIIYLTGATARDVLYASYALLEEILGVRWIFPGEAGEIVPNAKDIYVREQEIRDQPTLEIRGYHLTGIHHDEDTEKWMARNRLNFLFTPGSVFSNPNRHSIIERRENLGFEIAYGGHTMGTFLPRTLVETNPEYFAQVGGKHISNGQPDYCNPDVKQITVKAILDLLREYPQIDFINVTPYDNTLFGECLEHPNESVSTRVYRFVNEVAKEVNKEFPDVRVLCYAYSSYLDAPEMGPSVANQSINFCTFKCYCHEMDCEVNKKLAEQFVGWTTLGYKLHIRDYYPGITTPSMPLPLAHRISADISYWEELGSEGFFTELGPIDPKHDFSNWEMNKWTYYVGAKSMWNTGKRYEEVLIDGFNLYYGPAANEMLQLYLYLESVWKRYPVHLGWYSSPKGIAKNILELEPNLLKEINMFAIKAQEKVKGSNQVYKNRVAREIEILSLWEPVLKDITDWLLTIPHLEKQIFLDGNVKEEWEELAVIDGLVTKDGFYTEDTTEVYLGWEKDGLYLAFKLQDSNIRNIKAFETRHDGTVYSDDCVEVFIDPSNTGDSYYHFSLNPLGTRYEAFCTAGRVFDKSWDGYWSGNAKINNEEGYWVAEIRISFESLGKSPEQGEKWLINVTRNQKSKEKNVTSTWTNGIFHDPQSFGTIIFGQDVANINM